MKTGETGQQRVTSVDVARASGVSRATVSYVLNNDPRQSIPQETRERVLKAAQELGYHPFTAARVLRAGHSQLVLAVLPFEQIDPALARGLKDLEVRLAARGLTLICYFGLHLGSEAIHPSLNVTPSVLLSYADEDDPVMATFLQQFHVPILSVISDKTIQQSVGSMQANYLIQHGKHPFLFAASAREDVRFLTQSRLDGVRQAYAQWGIEEPVVRVLPFAREEVRAMMRDLLAQHAPPWGICCYNDEVAFAVLAALTDEGVAIPGDIAVIGCDNIPLAQFSIPPLTTVQFDRGRSFDPLVEMIVAASRGEVVSKIPQDTIAVIERGSVTAMV